MANEYQNFPELAADEARLMRRRKIAEMMQQQAIDPIKQQTAGGYVVPTHGLEAIAKIMQGYMGRKDAEGADADQLAIAEKAAGIQGAERQKIVDAITKTEAKPFEQNIMEGEELPIQGLVGQSARNQTPQDQLGSLIQASGSVRSTNNQKFVDTQQKHLENTIAREDAQQAKLDAAKIAAAAKLQSDKDRNAMMQAISGSKIASAEKIANGKAGASGNISTVDAKSIDKSIEKSTAANSALQLLENAEALYAKYDTDRAEPILGGLGRWGAAVGIGDENRASDYETGDQIAKDLGVIKLGLIGGSDTERELKVAIDTSPSPDKLPKTNREIIKNQKLAIEIIQSEPDFKTEWVNKTGSLSKLDENGGAYGQAWRKYQRDNFTKKPDSLDRRASDAKVSDAKKWALDPANANDPRLAAIKKKLGM